MKVNELRVGNLVLDGKEFITIGADEMLCACSGRCIFDPIPIADAEEWLLSVGFMEHKLLNRKRFWIVNWNINIFKGGKVKVSFNGLLYEHIKYVHQLQNLFYYSTDQELITKLNKYVQN